MNNWKTKDIDSIPDFIIGGAMKSGTTSLHQILDKHPDVFMAKGEIGFFDIDNICEHPDFNFFDGLNWNGQDVKKDAVKAWSWYSEKFKDANQKLKGEDSTTYLASPIAAERIALQEKNIKMIFILRNPTARTISNYFHLLKSGRAEYDLEDTLQYNPQSIIRRSLYKQQLKNYYEYFEPEHIKLILFEDFIAKPDVILEDICNFLNISFSKFSQEDLILHINKTVYPKHPKIQLIYNRLNRRIGKSRYLNSLPFKYDVINNKISLREKLLKKINKIINPKSEKYKPIVNASTKAYLDDFFKKEMNGIDQLTGLKIYAKWFKS